MLFKVSDNNFKNTELVAAGSLDELKLLASDELKFEVVKIVRASDGLEIKKNQTLIELAKHGELHVIGLDEFEEYTANLPTITKAPSILRYESEYLKVSPDTLPKKPGEIEDDDENDDDDEDDELQSITDLKGKLNKFKINLENKDKSKVAVSGDVAKPSTMSSVNPLTTDIYEKKLKEMSQILKKEEDSKLRYEKRLNKLNSYTTSIRNAQKEKEELKSQVDNREKELSRIRMDAETEISITKSKIADLEAKKLDLQIRKAKISIMFKEFVQAEKVDLCFLVDCTGSMGSYINEVKMVIHRITDKLSTMFKDFELRCAFVGYRDIEDGKDRVTVFAFQKVADAFKSFVNAVIANGGGDQCEDVFGGLEEVTKLEWSNMSRVLFHIADAPCHGKRFHAGANDNHPDGDPRGLNITNLIKKLNELNVKYYFAEINGSTIKMIEEFNKEISLIYGDLINVVKLASASDIAETVMTSIKTTVNATKSLSMATGGDASNKTVKKIRINKESLTWNKANLIKHDADLFVSKYVGGLENIKNKDAIQFDREPITIYIAELPFAKGAARYAYEAILIKNSREFKCVVKESVFNDDKSNSFEHYKELIESQLIANTLCGIFTSSYSKSEKSVKYLHVDILQTKKTWKYYSIEEYVDGKFFKWSNNAGETNEDIYANTLDAFSHWTYDITGTYLLVSDIQGWVSGSHYVLTDPAISSAVDYARFSCTNLNIKGIKKYFESHKCNNHCKSYGLKRHQAQPHDLRIGGTKLK